MSRRALFQGRELRLRHAQACAGAPQPRLRYGWDRREAAHCLAALRSTRPQRVLTFCGKARDFARLIDGREESAQFVLIAPPEQRLRARLASPRLTTVHGSAARLPFCEHAFDAALCLHAAYHWSGLERAFAEIARVTAPRGAFVLLLRAWGDEAGIDAFPGEAGCFRAVREVAAPLEAAGFAITRLEPARSGPLASTLILAQRR